MAPSIRGRRLKLRVCKDHLSIVDERGRRQIWLSRSNAVYTADIFNYFDYYFDAVKPFPHSGGDQIVDYSSPRFHQVAGFPDFPVLCPSLVEPYQTCRQYLDFADLTDGQIVLDLGGYSGLTAIAFSKAVGERGRVISIEPDPLNMTACTANIDLYGRLTGSRNITLLPVAVSGRSGTLAFSSEASMGSSAAYVVGSYRGTLIDVPAVTLDDLVSQSGIDRVDFIKMDIEGAEADVIRHAREFFTVHRPRLIIEPHIVDGILSAGEVMNQLTEYGYRCDLIEQFGVSLPLITAVPLTD